jgi:hypothetical protein
VWMIRAGVVVRGQPMIHYNSLFAAQLASLTSPHPPFMTIPMVRVSLEEKLLWSLWPLCARPDSFVVPSRTKAGPYRCWALFPGQDGIIMSTNERYHDYIAIEPHVPRHQKRPDLTRRKSR